MIFAFLLSATAAVVAGDIAHCRLEKVPTCTERAPETYEGKTCTQAQDEWSAALDCSITETQCPAVFGAYAGNCFAYNLIFGGVLAGDGCTVPANTLTLASECLALAENAKQLSNKTTDFDIGGCEISEVLACDATVAAAAATNDCDVKTNAYREYVECYSKCAVNRATNGFYGGICEASLTMSGCDASPGTERHAMCYSKVDGNGSGSMATRTANMVAILSIVAFVC